MSKKTDARHLMAQLEAETGRPAHTFYPAPSDSKRVRSLNSSACDLTHTDRIAQAWARVLVLADHNGDGGELTGAWKREYRQKSSYTSFEHIRVGGRIHSTPQHSGRTTYA